MTTTSLYLRLLLALTATALVGLFLLGSKSEAALLENPVAQWHHQIPYGF